MANNKHAVVRIDKLGGTLDGAQLASSCSMIRPWHIICPSGSMRPVSPCVFTL